MTLNQLISLLKGFVDEHAQLNDFGFGPVEDLEAPRDMIYPIMWVTMNPSRYSGKQMQYSLNLIFADLIYDDKKNEHEVQSDQQSIALDALAFLRDNPDFDFQAEGDASITYFTERFGSLCAGVVVQLIIRDPRPLDRCVIPS